MCALTEKVCEALNEALGADPEYVQWLVDRRKAVSKAFRRIKAPFVTGGDRRIMTLGPLGMINMVLIKAGCTCRVSAGYDRGKLVHFRTWRPKGTDCSR